MIEIAPGTISRDNNLSVVGKVELGGVNSASRYQSCGTYLEVTIGEEPATDISPSLIEGHNIPCSCKLRLVLSTSKCIIKWIILISAICGHVIRKLLPQHNLLSFPIVPVITSSSKSQGLPLWCYLDFVILRIDFTTKDPLVPSVLVEFNIWP